MMNGGIGIFQHFFFAGPVATSYPNLQNPYDHASFSSHVCTVLYKQKEHLENIGERLEKALGKATGKGPLIC